MVKYLHIIVTILHYPPPRLKHQIFIVSEGMIFLQKLDHK